MTIGGRAPGHPDLFANPAFPLHPKTLYGAARLGFELRQIIYQYQWLG
jgi:hypothetical protein